MIEANEGVKPTEDATPAPLEPTEDGSAIEQKPDNSKPEESDETAFDYKAEFERLSKRVDVAVGIATHERERRQDLQEKKPEEKTANDLLMERLEAQRMEDAADTVDELFESEITNPDERNLARWYYENRVNRQGYSRRKIKEDIADARVLANKHLIGKIRAEAKAEAKEAIKREQSASNSSGGSSTRRAPKASEPALNSDEKRLIEIAKKAAGKK